MNAPTSTATPSPSADPFEAALGAALDSPDAPAEELVEKNPRASRDVGEPEARKPKKPEPKKPEPQVDEQDDEDPSDDEPPDLAADSEGDEAAAEGEEQEPAEPARGTKENPYTAKDLPEDQYIEIKVDGQKMVVSAKELADGYIGQQTIHRRLNTTKQLSERAEEYVKKAMAFPEQFQRNFQSFTADPQGMFEFFFGVDPAEVPALSQSLRKMQAPKSRAEAAEQLAQLVAEMLVDERKTPGARERREATVERKRVEKERQALQEQKQREQQEKAQREANERARAIFEPGWADGLKRGGFPTLTKETHQKLYQEVIARVQMRNRNTQDPITSDVIAELTARSIRSLQEDGVIPRKKAKPQPVTPSSLFGARAKQEDGKPQQPGQRRGVKDWDKVPSSVRKQDPDFFLSKVPAKAFIRK